MDIVEFFHTHLRHSRGDGFAGKRFILEQWQQDMLNELFRRRPDGKRKHRTAYIEIPRKNGKSTLGAGIALYLLAADGEPGAHIYSCASDTDQARIVFQQAREMIDSSPLLSSLCRPLRNEIIMRPLRKGDGESVYKAISAEAYSKHGYQPHGIIFDELHAQPNRELWDVMITGTACRSNPLTLAITTAGYDRNSICWEMHEYARQVIAGTIQDDSFFGRIWAAPEDGDWTSPDVWREANPNFGVSLDEEYMDNECRKAVNSPSYQNTFRRLHLNQWTSQDKRWLDMRAWDACDDKFALPELTGRPCYGGLDLASTTDIAALVLVFPMDDRFALLPFFWIPSDNMVDRSRRDRVPYEAWVRDGYIQATPGNCIWMEQIYTSIGKLAETYDIRSIAFDRWGATSISQRLQDDGINMVQFGQGFASMNAPSKDFLRLVMERKIIHNNNPVLRWMADNVVVSTDPAGNIKPNKARSTEKIDGIVAAIMGMDMAIRQGQGFDPERAFGSL